MKKEDVKKEDVKIERREWGVAVGSGRRGLTDGAAGREASGTELQNEEGSFAVLRMTGETNVAKIEDPAILTKALESLLIEKGLITAGRVDEIVKSYEEDIGPVRGTQVVAKAWVDAEYKARLLEDGRSAIAEMGFTDPHGAELVVTENTDDVHNLVVCTLCSCYPWAVLGLPPSWYKSFAYRSRAVSEPRSVLKEFGLELPESTEVRVWDSNSDIRYMVLPKRPVGTEGMSEEELAELVTRDSMIGVGVVKTGK